MLTALGGIELNRLYLVCAACGDTQHPLDHRLGVDGYVTRAARRLLCLAGASWSFDEARDKLKEFCGLDASDELIRRIAEATGGVVAEWMRTSSAAVTDFPRAPGEVEFETDATKVNTTTGWRDTKIGLFAKRPAGPSVTTAEWADRDLPKPTARFAFAGIAESTAFAADWRPTARRLGIDPDTAALTVLADGAEWIWNRVGEQFPRAAGVLDVFHAIEHVADAAKACFGDGSTAAREQTDRGRTLLLADGYAGVVDWVGELTARTDLKFDAAPLGGLLNYLAGHQDRLNYALRLHRGQSIGSGQVEGAAKNMIGRRLKANNCRWIEANVNKMAGLAAAIYSNCWTEFWESN